MLHKTQLQIFGLLLILGFFIYAILLFASYGSSTKLYFSSSFFPVNQAEEIKPVENVTQKYKAEYPNQIIYFKSQCECKREEQIVLHKYKSHFVVKTYNSTQNSSKFLYKIKHNEFKRLNLTCGMYNSLRRGKSQKILGFSLYGNNTFFYEKLKVIVKQVSEIYAGWSIRIYHDNTIKKSIICEIECALEKTKNKSRLFDNADFCNIENDTHLMPIKLDFLNISYTNFSYVHAMKWRWMPMGDSFVEAFSSRDTDSYLLQREVDSVNVWKKSNKVGHIMRGKVIYFFLVRTLSWLFLKDS